MPTAAVPSAFDRLDAWLRRARRRVLTRSLFRCATFALAATLVYEAGSSAALVALGQDLYFPPFPLLAFAVFAYRERRRWSAAETAGCFDAEFALKDRLRSYVEFSRRDDMDPALRAAQAGECLASIPLDSVTSRFRVRPPGAFYVVLPLFLALAAVRVFVAPNPVLLVLGPGGGPGAPDLGEPGSAPPIRQREEPSADGPGERAAAGRPEGENSAGGAKPEQGAPSEAGPGSGARPSAPRPGAGDPGSRVSARDGLDVETPPSLDSSPVSGQVAAPVEVAMEATPTFEVERFREALHALTLLPSRLGVATAPGEPDALLLLGWRPGRYPARYRDHLRSYAVAVTRTGEETHGTPGETR